MSTTLITRAEIINEGKRTRADLLIRDDRIESIIPAGKELFFTPDKIIDAGGSYLLPGVIDDQVHFREPGLTHKGDLFHESRAAVAGGITSYMEMPNTFPQTTTQQLLEDKYTLASKVSLANYSFYIGATNDNLEELLNTDPAKVCGIKIFMGSSTGNMLVNDPETLKAIFSRSPMLIAVHCEDETIIQDNIRKARDRFGEDVPVYLHPVIRNSEACFRSSRLAVSLAEQYNTRLHILHLSTAAEMSLFTSGVPLTEKRITAEVCVHHLLFDDRDYFTRGNLIKWNPAIKTAEDKNALLKALIEGQIDVVATDHAPHTLEEKQNTYFKAPSGGPLVQHSLTAMLEFYNMGKLSLEMIVEKMCHAPATIFKVAERGFIREGYYADLVLVNPDKPWTVSTNNLHYKCQWSPLLGMQFSNQVTHTFVNGHLAYCEGVFFEEKKGRRLTFSASGSQ
jgi:dihydroorotase